MVNSKEKARKGVAKAKDGDGRLAEIAAAVEAQRYPPVDRWAPERVEDIDMRIGRNGTWYYMGSPISRPAMVRLFSSVLRREGEEFYLVTPVEKLRIKVDDAPYLAVEMTSEGEGRERVIAFRTQTGEHVIADAEHPIRVATDPATGEPSPYVLVRAGLEALIARSVFYDLVEMAETSRENGRERLQVWSEGIAFPLGELASDDTERG